MRKFILVFNPKDNTRSLKRLNLDCYHIVECLDSSARDLGTGAKAIRKALQGFKRLVNLNVNQFLYFNFSKISNPNRKRPLAIKVTKRRNAFFWSKVVKNLIRQLGMSLTVIKIYAKRFERDQ